MLEIHFLFHTWKFIGYQHNIWFHFFRRVNTLSTQVESSCAFVVLPGMLKSSQMHGGWRVTRCLRQPLLESIWPQAVSWFEAKRTTCPHVTLSWVSASCLNLMTALSSGKNVPIYHVYLNIRWEFLLNSSSKKLLGVVGHVTFLHNVMHICLICRVVLCWLNVVSVLVDTAADC